MSSAAGFHRYDARWHPEEKCQHLILPPLLGKGHLPQGVECVDASYSLCRGELGLCNLRNDGPTL